MGAGASVTDKKASLAKKGLRSLEDVKNLPLLAAMERLEVIHLHKNALAGLSSRVRPPTVLRALLARACPRRPGASAELIPSVQVLREAISAPHLPNNLRELTLSHNVLDSIPNELFYLVNLKVLLLVRAYACMVQMGVWHSSEA